MFKVIFHPWLRALALARVFLKQQGRVHVSLSAGLTLLLSPEAHQCFPMPVCAIGVLRALPSPW